MRLGGTMWLLQETCNKGLTHSSPSLDCLTLPLWTTAVAISPPYFETLCHTVCTWQILFYLIHLPEASLPCLLVICPHLPTFKWGTKKLSNLTKITQPGLLDSRTYVLNDYFAKSTDQALLTEYQATTQFIWFNCDNKRMKAVLWVSDVPSNYIEMIFNYLLIICCKCSLFQ